jgi:hypothetical protein
MSEQELQATGNSALQLSISGLQTARGGEKSKRVATARQKYKGGNLRMR